MVYAPSSFADLTDDAELAAEMAQLYDNIEDVDLMVGLFAEKRPAGFAFAPHPVVTETDRDKYCVQRIIDSYNRRQVDLADYFQAAHAFRQRAKLGKPDAKLFAMPAECRPLTTTARSSWKTLSICLSKSRAV